MQLFKHNSWAIWGGSVRPSESKCSKEPCTCQYHVVSDDNTQTFSFDDYQEAEKKFMELSGTERYNPFKQTV